MSRSHAATTHHRASKHPREQGNTTPKPRARLRARAAVFFVLVAAAIGAVILVWPRPADVASAEQAVQINMGGFNPAVVTAQAGEPLRLKLINPDSQFHSDGAGWHQLAIPALGIDARVAPRSQSVVEISAAQPGEYAFYCDICCGGKENPSMQGILRVEV